MEAGHKIRRGMIETDFPLMAPTIVDQGFGDRNTDSEFASGMILAIAWQSQTVGYFGRSRKWPMLVY